MCSVCRQAHHLWCVDPPLLHVPLRSWTCPDHAHFALSPYTHILPQRTVALQFEQEPLSAPQSRRKGLAFRAVQQRVAERREVAQGLGRLQTELLEQSGRALEAKVAQGPGAPPPDETVGRTRLEQLREGRGEAEAQAAELREYAARTQAVLRRAHELGAPLRVPAFVLEEAALGRVPTLAQLESVSPAALAAVDPLLLQFLAWQRLVQLAERREAPLRRQTTAQARVALVLFLCRC